MSKGNSHSYNYFLYDSDCHYPDTAPYNPDERYPEYPFEFVETDAIYKNDIYRMVREIFKESKMDFEEYNTLNWNPLGEYVKPYDTVLIKPNLVIHNNMAEKNDSQLECLITHPSIVRCLFDYTYIALGGKGKIIIADAPVQDCRFDLLLQKTGYGELFKELESKNSDELIIDIADLRDTYLEKINGKQRQREIKNKKYTSVIIDLRNDSKFVDIEYKNKLRISNYASEDTIWHHDKGRNEYCVSRAMLEADVIINIPKPKTHRIAGYTAALKNMIGINTRKEYLPHHRKGAKEENGDEYIGTHKMLKWINSTGNDLKNWALKKQINILVDFSNEMCRYLGKRLDRLEDNRKKFGMWYGNDTIWRTILDVNKIVYFADKEGQIHKEKQRKVLHLGDMIVCGEKEGPLRPSYKRVGGILFSDNPVSFDYCVTKLMGFDYRKFPVLVNALGDEELIEEDMKEIRLYSNEKEFDQNVAEISKNFNFKPSDGWKEYL